MVEELACGRRQTGLGSKRVNAGERWIGCSIEGADVLAEMSAAGARKLDEGGGLCGSRKRGLCGTREPAEMWSWVP